MSRQVRESKLSSIRESFLVSQLTRLLDHPHQFHPRDLPLPQRGRPGRGALGGRQSHEPGAVRRPVRGARAPGRGHRRAGQALSGNRNREGVRGQDHPDPGRRDASQPQDRVRARRAAAARERDQGFRADRRQPQRDRASDHGALPWEGTVRSAHGGGALRRWAQQREWPEGCFASCSGGLCTCTSTG